MPPPSGLGANFGPAGKSAAANPRPAFKGGNGTTVTVAQGDSLLTLSRKHNVPISVLMEANGLKELKIEPGSQLFVPAVGGSRR